MNMPDVTHTRSLFPCLQVVDERASALPLELTEVKAEVTGPLALVTVKQSFRNPLKQPAELVYLFPLPPRGAVVDFEFQVGGRRVSSALEEIDPFWPPI